jgi:thioredoxin reductase
MKPMHFTFDTIIIGGSYAGMSAGMALGRSLRNVLIIDSGKPCNWQTPHSHNFITQDGKTPTEIVTAAKAQVLQYPTVKFVNGLVTGILKKDAGFLVSTVANETFSTKKLLFATGLSDHMPAIDGFAECWGISVLHCPYCHGYEVRGEKMGIIGNGDAGFELCRLISNWSEKLILFTNGESTLTSEHIDKIRKHNIEIEERKITRIHHTDGKMRSVLLEDQSEVQLTALFARPQFSQHCDIPQRMGCELTEHGFIKTNDFLQTTVRGIYAAGDNMTMLRSVSSAVATGARAGVFINKELIDESF